MPDTIRLRDEGFILSSDDKPAYYYHLPHVLYAEPEEPPAKSTLMMQDDCDLATWQICLVASVGFAIAATVVFAIVGLITVLTGS